MKIKNYFRSLLMTLLIVFGVSTFAQYYPGTIDIGIFETTNNQIEVKIMPTHNTQFTLTNMQFTVRTPDTTNNLIFDSPVYPYNLIPEATIIDNGYKYQVFSTLGGHPLNLVAGQESVVATFRCTKNTGNFEILDSWVYYVNPHSFFDGTYYVEILGYDVTGNVYNDIVDYNFAATLPVITEVGSFNSTTHVDTISIPITVKDLNNIKAISLALNYDDNLLTWNSYNNHNFLNTGNLIVNSNGDQVVISWFSLVPITILYDTLIELEFIVNNNGSSNLCWDLGVPGNCEYTDVNLNIVPAQYSDGYVEIVSPNVLTIANSIKTCNNTVIVPIYAENIFDMAAISLTLNYDTNKLEYIGYQNLHADFQKIFGNVFINDIDSEIKFSWFGLYYYANFGSGRIVEYIFTKKDVGITNLEWVLVPGDDCEYMDKDNNIINGDYINGIVETEYCSSIYGGLTYDNIISSPLNNCSIYLDDTNNLTPPIKTTTTNLYGDYTFADLLSDGYILSTDPCKPWGGVNATDALAVAYHFTNILPLQGMKLEAADVTADGGVNSTDALAISRRFVGFINYFPSGDWLLTEEYVNINQGTSTNVNLKALCYGDVDGSYVPSIIRKASNVNLINSDVIFYNGGEVITVPVNIEEGLEVGAISLILNYPDELEILSVDMDNNDYVYNVNNGVLRIAWYNITPILTSDKAIFTMKCKIKDGCERDMGFFVNEYSEIANSKGKVIENAKVEIPILKLKYDFEIESIYPMPVIKDGVISLEFRVPRYSEVSYDFYDVSGRHLKKFVKNLEKGHYQEYFQFENYDSGVYFLVLTVDGKSISKKIIVK